MTVHEEKHKLSTRWFHWINFPILSLMIFSGLLIYWSYDPYRIGLGGITLFHFFPDWFYNATHIDHKLAFGMALHFFFAWIFAIGQGPMDNVDLAIPDSLVEKRTDNSWSGRHDQ